MRGSVQNWSAQPHAAGLRRAARPTHPVGRGWAGSAPLPSPWRPARAARRRPVPWASTTSRDVTDLGRRSGRRAPHRWSTADFSDRLLGVVGRSRRVWRGLHGVLSPVRPRWWTSVEISDMPPPRPGRRGGGRGGGGPGGGGAGGSAGGGGSGRPPRAWPRGGGGGGGCAGAGGGGGPPHGVWGGRPGLLLQGAAGAADL